LIAVPDDSYCGPLYLSVVLAGHPKLKNDLRRPALEEIGSRASVFELEGIKGHQRRYLAWLLEQCTRPKVKPDELLTEQALERLAECLTTPLQIEHYLILALEQAYHFGEKPVTPEIIETVMAPDLNALVPTLTRHGYNVKALSELLNLRQAEVKAFLHG
jgi:type II secretory pathway predicted ATPase ExeA